MEENTNPRPEENLPKEGAEENKAVETAQEENAKPETEGTIAEEKTEETKAVGVVHDLSGIEESAPDQIDGEYHPVANPAEVGSDVFAPVHYHNDKTHTIDEDLENIRKTYAKKIGKSSRFNIISIVLMAVSFVGILLTIILNDSEELAWVTWVVFGIALVLIIGSFVGSNIIYKKATGVSMEYLSVYQDAVSGYIAEKLDVKDPLFSAAGTIDDQEVIQAHCFKTINHIRSRCVLRGERNGRPFVTGECVIGIPDKTIEEANARPENLVNLDGTPYVPDPRETTTSTQELPANDMTMIDIDLADELSSHKEREKREKEADRMRKNAAKPVTIRNGLVGRFYSYRLRIDPEESFIICFTGNPENTTLPDYVSNFTPVHVAGLKKNIVVYLADLEKGAKFFDESMVSLLNEIAVDNVVYSLFLSMNSYGVKIGMNLSDDIFELPMRNPVSLGCMDTFVTASQKAFAFVDEVEKRANVLKDEA